MVVRLHFHQGMGQFAAETICAIRARIETLHLRALDHRGVIRIGHHRALGMQRVGVAYHPEQGDRLLFVVYHPIRVEYLVAAMFRIRLREHHQFHIGGIAVELVKILCQILDLICGKCQPQFTVGRIQRCTAAVQDVHAGQGLRRVIAEYTFCYRLKIHLLEWRCRVMQQRLGHAVMQQRVKYLQFFWCERLAIAGLDVIHDATLDARNHG